MSHKVIVELHLPFHVLLGKETREEVQDAFREWMAYDDPANPFGVLATAVVLDWENTPQDSR